MAVRLAGAGAFAGFGFAQAASSPSPRGLTPHGLAPEPTSRALQRVSVAALLPSQALPSGSEDAFALLWPLPSHRLRSRTPAGQTAARHRRLVGRGRFTGTGCDALVRWLISARVRSRGPRAARSCVCLSPESAPRCSDFSHPTWWVRATGVMGSRPLVGKPAQNRLLPSAQDARRVVRCYLWKRLPCRPPSRRLRQTPRCLVAQPRSRLCVPLRARTGAFPFPGLSPVTRGLSQPLACLGPSSVSSCL